MNAAPPSTANRLAGEQSPYLLQHRHNPVDWFPWGEAAFQKARQEHKPIFLSIGYSTCHWCHVMERESFENPETARILNTHFVNIKVDREERPDVDAIYLAALRAIGGQGGWPLNVFLTPDLKLFYGGTYFPPQSRQNLPGFPQLLQQIHQTWTTRQEEVLRSATEIHHRLQHLRRPPTVSDSVLTPAILHDAAAIFADEYEEKFGGFGSAPKFPRPSLPSFLLRYGIRYRDPDAVDMVLHTCDRMMAGGLRDQLGGGFARYSVDDQWQVPHFEKMLYDNAQLANLYLDAFLVSGESRYAEVVHDVLAYVRRDMTHPDGGFYSAEDADSEGKEGKFYCWTRGELADRLSPDEFAVTCRYFGVTESGNFLDHSDPHPLLGQNVLHVAQPDLSPAERTLLMSAKAKLLAARQQRIRPHLDDKILASWNGLMLGAYARAGAVLGEESYRRTAAGNLAFLQQHLWDARTQTLYHRWRDGSHDAIQLASAYAFLLAGIVDLYETTIEPAHLEFAVALAEQMTVRFQDQEHGGFWQTDAQTAHLVLRLKDEYDGAEPAGNSVAVLALLKLAAITQRADLRKTAEHSLRSLGSRWFKTPQAVPYLLCALDFWLEEPRRVVIVGDPQSADTQQMIQAAHGVFQPNKIVAGQSGPVDPWIKTLPAATGTAVAYACSGKACRSPTKNPGDIRRWLREPA